MIDVANDKDLINAGLAIFSDYSACISSNAVLTGKIPQATSAGTRQLSTSSAAFTLNVPHHWSNDKGTHSTAVNQPAELIDYFCTCSCAPHQLQSSERKEELREGEGGGGGGCREGVGGWQWGRADSGTCPGGDNRTGCGGARASGQLLAWEAELAVGSSWTGPHPAVVYASCG
jgi:hypothetical protein